MNKTHPATDKVTLQEMEAFWQATEDFAVAEEISAQDSLQRLATCNLDEMILLFRHYRLFTIQHIDDLAIVFSRLPFGELKAFFSKVLYEEFGMETEGGFANNHVHLLDSLMVSMGADRGFCSDPTVELPSNLELLNDITDQCLNASLPFAVGLRGMGTECLCQVYLTTIFNMVEKNPIFIANKDKLDLRFEQLHRGEVERLHRVHMREMIASLIRDNPEQLPELVEGYKKAQESFHVFFENIYLHIDSVLNTKDETPEALIAEEI